MTIMSPLTPALVTVDYSRTTEDAYEARMTAATAALPGMISPRLSITNPDYNFVSFIDNRTLYSAEQGRRHHVRPGLTGLAQVSGRNALTWDDKFALDVRYVDHWSMGLDWKILGATAWRVLTRHGISHEQHATAPRFEGNKRDG